MGNTGPIGGRGPKGETLGQLENRVPRATKVQTAIKDHLVPKGFKASVENKDQEVIKETKGMLVQLVHKDHRVKLVHKVFQVNKENEEIEVISVQWAHKVDEGKQDHQEYKEHVDQLVIKDQSGIKDQSVIRDQMEIKYHILE
jgi:hypothetical protein